MARFDWDRLRRTRPLDGADVRVDPDGGHLWERPGDEAPLPFGGRRLRNGVIVRRRQERADGAAVSAPADLRDRPAPVASRSKRTGPIRCQRCGAGVSPRKLLRHARRCPAASDPTPS
ncbi:MAG: hypothetical protein BGO98_05030 [Myxococcales bacterium 68-20]|nr:hypothetical protein [Myxococcales bacterium]OJY16179.1 MAG: hypothetical protein BGO98_05030 [Myxococcales bacterium 68-20]